MRSFAKYTFAALVFFSPALANAQNVGEVACAHQDSNADLYTSMTTLEVLRTLQCGERLDIIGRYEGYFGVRTAKGEVGYVAQGNVFLFRGKPPAPKPVAPAPVHSAPAGFDLTLPNNTPVHLKLVKTLSSETAHVGDVVDLTVQEDVLVDGLCVVPRGSSVVGIVTEAEPKKRLGHGGKLGLGVNFIQLADKEKAPVRSFQESSGASTGAGGINPLAHGKEVVFAQGTEIVAYVDGDVHLKRSAFQPPKDAAPAATAQNPPQSPKH